MTTFHRAVFVAAVILGTIPAAAYPIVPRSILKTFFQTGDVPNQDQFLNITNPTGVVASGETPDIQFIYGTGAVHLMEGLGGTEFLTDGSGHPLFLSVGDRPTSGQFGSVIDSALNMVDDRALMAFRFTRTDGIHYGFMDFSIGAPLPGFPTEHALNIHGWAYETEPNTPITVFSIPAPGACTLMGIGAVVAMRRRRV